MERLQKLQKQMWNAFTSPILDVDCTKSIDNTEKLSALNRLNIYRNTIRTAHTSSIAAVYPCCERILGKKYFKQLSNQFFYKNPAKSQNLNEYGNQFPDFLESWVIDHSELSELLYLPDLARLELAIEKAYFAKDSRTFTLENDLNMNVQQICLIVNHSLSILRSHYPIYEIWKLNQRNDYEQDINAIQQDQFLCIVREEYEPMVYTIEEPYWWVLDKCIRGVALDKMVELALNEEVNFEIDRIIQQMIKRNWICGVNSIGKSSNV